MVQFTKLRLTGFKSFVDPTELLIEPGLTGVVGPNGCGKSNIVDALRWAMGEHSARQLRGGEMDDVIFGGTSNRPPRNNCEVTITLDNSDRTAPAAFNENAELEVTRRIDRGEGSGYKINGADVRARDVQLLFADAASGSRSTAIVSQGQVGAVIAAKPTERRAILEEAAGITGLYSRRHEAELRLRAAEANLARLDDVIAALDAQHQSLKKQARQATRYRNLSDHIRKAEAQMLHLRWTVATKALEEANARVKILDLYALYNLPYINQVQLLFRATLLDLDFSPGVESLEVQLFAEHEIPWDTLAFRPIRTTLEQFFADRKTGEFKFHTADLEPPVRKL